MLGAEVRISIPGQNPQEIYRARTMANGQVLFHPLTLDASLEQVDTFLVQVHQGDEHQQFELARLSAQPATHFTDEWTVSLDQALQPAESLNLDILFLIDATGSMADEIAKIQSTIFEVSASIDNLPGQPNVRYGLVTYRDRGDAYVTRRTDFTPNISDFSDSLDMVRADGGGDYPESLNEAMHEALHNVEWRAVTRSNSSSWWPMRPRTWITPRTTITPWRWRRRRSRASKFSPSPAAGWMTRANTSSGRLPSTPRASSSS
jgi:hypothetical protein